VSFEEQATAWIEWARWPLDAYWFYNDAFFELLPPPCRTLEVGCGEGRVSRDLRERGYDVVGLDPSRTLLAAAREADPAGDYLLGSAEALPFGAGAFDLVVAYNALMDVDDMPGAIGEIGRVLGPGGVLCACITHPMVDSGRWADEETFVIGERYLDRRRFEATFERPDLPPFTFHGWIYPLETHSRRSRRPDSSWSHCASPPLPTRRSLRGPGRRAGSGCRTSSCSARRSASRAGRPASRRP
jgi:SAM-dependent methyltransferase